MFRQYPSTLLLAALLLLTPAYGKPPFHEAPNEPWGFDADLTRPPMEKEEIKNSVPSKACQGAIRFFQVYISPIDGPRSSYIPTSSMYTLLAIRKYGVLQGIAMGCDRLMRENGEMWIYPITNDYGQERKVDPLR